MEDQNNQQQTSHEPTPAPAQTSSHAQGGSFMQKLEAWFEEYLGHKAPQLPEKWREVIVKLAPWITLILMLLAIPAILFLLGVGAALAPVAILSGAGNGVLYIVGLALTAVAIILEVMSINGLFKRSITGWRYAYWATLVSAVSAIFGGNFGSLIGTVISLYFLFQIKKYYR
jgi:hypothetical protein